MALLDVAGTTDSYGFGIAAKLGKQHASVYLILRRLVEYGWVTSAWEDGEPKVLERPRRRLYTLTPTGRRMAEISLSTTHLEAVADALRVLLLGRVAILDGGQPMLFASGVVDRVWHDSERVVVRFAEGPVLVVVDLGAGRVLSSWAIHLECEEPTHGTSP